VGIHAHAVWCGGRSSGRVFVHKKKTCHREVPGLLC
jgi:hypothetical protein